MDTHKRGLSTATRYLTFNLKDEVYGIEILTVKELMGITKITPLPQTPDFIKGVINLRGMIVPVVDLRLKFGMSAGEYNKRTSVVVAEVLFENQKILMGIVVDAIQEVIAIAEDKISRVAYVRSKIRAEYIKGVANTEEGMIILLDVSRILNDDDLGILKEATNGSST